MDQIELRICTRGSARHADAKRHLRRKGSTFEAGNVTLFWHESHGKGGLNEDVLDRKSYAFGGADRE